MLLICVVNRAKTNRIIRKAESLHKREINLLYVYITKYYNTNIISSKSTATKMEFLRDIFYDTLSIFIIKYYYRTLNNFPRRRLVYSNCKIHLYVVCKLSNRDIFLFSPSTVHVILRYTLKWINRTNINFLLYE